MKILTTALYSFIIEVLWILNTVRYNWSLRATPSTLRCDCLTLLTTLNWLTSYKLCNSWKSSLGSDLNALSRRGRARRHMRWHWSDWWEEEMLILTISVDETIIRGGRLGQECHRPLTGLWQSDLLQRLLMSPQIITVINIEIFWRLHCIPRHQHKY